MSDSPHHRRLFDEALARLVGQPCWGLVAGAGTGTHFELRLGARIPRGLPLSNTKLEPRVRDHDAELGVFVTCAWRVDAAERVVGGCWESNLQAGPMLATLATLVDQTITAAVATHPGLDLELRFSNGHVLRVFCDQTDEAEPGDNYSVDAAGWTSIVGCRSILSTEYRKPVLLR